MPLQRLRPEDKTEVWHPRKSVRLHLDDVDEVLAVLTQTSPVVAAVTPDFVGGIETAEELKVTGQRVLTHLELGVGNPDRRINVELKMPVTVRIVPRDALDLAGASQRIQDVLSSRQERFGGWHFTSDSSASQLYQLVAATLAMFATFAGVAATASRRSPGSGSDVSGWVWVLSGAILLVLLLLTLSRKVTGPNKKPRATVVLAYRADAPTWWERNRSSVLIGLATNVGTGLLFFLLGLWLGGG